MSRQGEQGQRVVFRTVDEVKKGVRQYLKADRDNRKGYVNVTLNIETPTGKRATGTCSLPFLQRAVYEMGGSIQISSKGFVSLWLPEQER